MTVKELKSLLGKLFFVSKCVVASRAFTRRRRMVHLVKGTCFLPKSTVVQLDEGFHADLRWWSIFLQKFNGVSLLSLSSASQAQDLHFHVFTTLLIRPLERLSDHTGLFTLGVLQRLTTGDCLKA